MGIFDFFKRKPRVQPRVEWDETGVISYAADGSTTTMKWTDLSVVGIQTTADGPLSGDLFWVLFGEDFENGCFIPSEADGMDGLLERLQELPGFDSEAVIQAMSSVEENRFVCWKRDE